MYITVFIRYRKHNNGNGLSPITTTVVADAVAIDNDIYGLYNYMFMYEWNHFKNKLIGGYKIA